jgi:gustatory receptor
MFPVFSRISFVSNMISSMSVFLDGIIFYLCGLTVGIYFFQLAKCWHEISEKFYKVDKLFQQSNYTRKHGKWSLKKRINIATTFLLLVAFTEHLASWSSYLYEKILQSKECNWEIDNWIYYLCYNHLRHIYNIFTIGWTSTIWAEYMNVSLTFSWNFLDIFIIISSLMLAFKYETINNRLEQYRGRKVSA